jgi:serine/threonine protein kinase
LGKLRWGHHTLEVQAQLASGSWSPMTDQLLDVPWPVWLSWPMLLLYGAGGAGIGIGTAHWTKRQRFQRGLSLPDLTAWRMRALSPEIEPLLGTVIDERYEIGHILSVGGFATVARARDLRHNGAFCAVKIFRYEFGDRAWIRHRFEQEIAALEQLSHPNIVRITGHGAIDTGAPYLVMEFIQGHSLREHLEQGTVPRNQIGLFLRQLAGALAALHHASIYHRDLKPENLMIRSGANNEKEIVLIDFSIAIVKSPDQTFHGISRVAGTLDYMAPEQVIGYADASTDIYSLAKILLEMVTGLRWAEFLPEAKLDLPEQIRGYFTEHPGLFQADSLDLIVSALAFDPAGRPKDVMEFARPIIRDLGDASRATSAGSEVS